MDSKDKLIEELKSEIKALKKERMSLIRERDALRSHLGAEPQRALASLSERAIRHDERKRNELTFNQHLQESIIPSFRSLHTLEKRINYVVGTATIATEVSRLRDALNGYDAALADSLITFIGYARMTKNPALDDESGASYRQSVAELCEGVQRLTRGLDNGEYLREVIQSGANQKLQGLIQGTTARLESIGRPEGHDEVILYLFAEGERIELEHKDEGYNNYDVVKEILDEINQADSPTLLQELTREYILKKWRNPARWGANYSKLHNRVIKDK